MLSHLAADVKQGHALEAESRALVSRAKRALEQRVPKGSYGAATVSRKPEHPRARPARGATRKLLDAEGLAVLLMERAPTIVITLDPEAEAVYEDCPIAVAGRSTFVSARDFNLSDILAGLDARLAATC